MRFEDLTFELRGYLRGDQIVGLRRHGLEGLHDRALSAPLVIERAEVTFPNGRSLSILRGMLSAGAVCDFETCRLGVKWPQSITHKTIEDVQREMDAVAALPPL